MSGGWRGRASRSCRLARPANRTARHGGAVDAGDRQGHPGRLNVLDPFYPIVPDSDWVARLVPAGARLVQLRIKDRPAAEIRRQVKQAKAACAATGAQLIVNDYSQAAIAAGCHFVPLGPEDLLDSDVTALRRAGLPTRPS